MERGSRLKERAKRKRRLHETKNEEKEAVKFGLWTDKSTKLGAYNF